MTVIQHRRGTTTEWAASSYILEAGELGIEIDTSTTPDNVIGIKVGNGESLWAALDYVGSGDLSNINSLTFDTTPTSVPNTQGTMSWDSGEGTPSINLDPTNGVSLQLGQEQLVLCYNGTGSTIPKGSAVYISGAQGQRPSISLADADAESTSSKTMGVTSQAISNGVEGFVNTFGIISGVDTSAFTAGSALWLSSTAGGITATKPSAPAHTVFIGYALHQNASSGRIFVNPQNGYEVDELHDVSITSLAAGHLLVRNTTNTLWENQTASEAGLSEVGHTHTVSNITDISTNYAALTGASFTGTVNVTTANNGSSVILKNTDGTGVRVIAGESVSGSLPGVIFSPYVTGTEKTASQFYYADNGDQWVFEPTLKLGNGYLTSGSATGYIFNTIATTLNIGGAATTLNLGAATGNTTIANNLVVSGNLTVNGDQIINNTATVEVEDSIIYIGTGNTGDSMDIGIVGHRTPSGGSYQHTGFVRDATDGVWKLFTGVTTEPSGSTLDFTGATYEPIKIGALDATSGSFSSTLGVTGAATLSSTLGVTGDATLSSTLAVTGVTTLTGALTANGGITGAAAKNMTVASKMPGGVANGTGVAVVMTAATSTNSAPENRPDGTALQAGDIWISW